MIRFLPPEGVANGTVVLDRAAPPGGMTVVLTSLNPAVATVPAAVVLPEGYLGMGFPITWAGAGVTQIKAELDGREALLDVAAAGVIPSLRPETRLDLVVLAPDAKQAGEVDPRPEPKVALPLRPDPEASEPEQPLRPNTRLGQNLRPKPYVAG